MLTKNESLLSVHDVKKYFPIKGGLFSKQKSFVRAVDGINLEVNQGETLGIVGESGSGKSTLGDMIVNLSEPTEGAIWFNGNHLGELNRREMRKVRKDIQIIFQDPFNSLNPKMTVKEILLEPLKVNRVDRKESTKLITQLLDDVGLGERYLARYPHELSGGQRQRIGIARALTLNPKLIICDEPVSALDVSTQAQILNLLKRLQKQYELTFVFIAHGLPSVKYMSDRIAVMYLGRIVELTTQDALFKHPYHPYTEALISAVPNPNPMVKKERIVLKGDIPNPANPPSGCPFHTRCPYAQAICKQETPEFKEIADGHFTACHFPL